MKEIKAYIRISRVDEVIHELRSVGAPGITVTRVHGVGYGYEPYLFTLAPSELKKTPEVAKVEVVCEDDCAEGAIQIIDGNLLAPLLISEVVDLHPIAVIAAILIFGGMAYRRLPVSDLPNVDFPTIQVSASLPILFPVSRCSHMILNERPDGQEPVWPESRINGVLEPVTHRPAP